MKLFTFWILYSKNCSYISALNSLIPNCFFINLYWYNQNIRISNVLLSITWLQWFIPRYALSFNAPSWTISSEILFYTLFPLLLRIFINNSFRKIGLIVLSIYIFSQSFILLQVFSNLDFIQIMNQKFWHDFIYYFPFFHISDFLIGMLCARAYIESTETSKIWYEWYFLIFFFWLILTLILGHKNIMIHNGFLAPLFACIIFLLARSIYEDWLQRFESFSENQVMQSIYSKSQ